MKSIIREVTLREGESFEPDDDIECYTSSCAYHQDDDLHNCKMRGAVKDGKIEVGSEQSDICPFYLDRSFFEDYPPGLNIVERPPEAWIERT